MNRWAPPRTIRCAGRGGGGRATRPSEAKEGGVDHRPRSLRTGATHACSWCCTAQPQVPIGCGPSMRLCVSHAAGLEKLNHRPWLAAAHVCRRVPHAAGLAKSKPRYPLAAARACVCTSHAAGLEKVNHRPWLVAPHVCRRVLHATGLAKFKPRYHLAAARADRRMPHTTGLASLTAGTLQLVAHFPLVSICGSFCFGTSEAATRPGRSGPGGICACGLRAWRGRLSGPRCIPGFLIRLPHIGLGPLLLFGHRPLAGGPGHRRAPLEVQGGGPMVATRCRRKEKREPPALWPAGPSPRLAAAPACAGHAFSAFAVHTCWIVLGLRPFMQLAQPRSSACARFQLALRCIATDAAR